MMSLLYRDYKRKNLYENISNSKYFSHIGKSINYTQNKYINKWLHKIFLVNTKRSNYKVYLYKTCSKGEISSYIFIMSYPTMHFINI